MRRLVDVFKTTKRSGELWVGDAELLETLPQGMAKLATLKARELMNAPKATTTRGHNAAGRRNADAKYAEPPEKKPSMHQENSGTEGMGAAEHVDRMAVATATAEQEPGRETRIQISTPELFRSGTTRDHALIEWLLARKTQPRCDILSQQICEWRNQSQRDMRRLAETQSIILSRSSQTTSELLLEEVRKHFRNAIAQQKGRLASFDRH